MDGYSIPIYYLILQWLLSPVLLILAVVFIIIIVKSRNKKSSPRMNDNQKTLREFIQTAKAQGTDPASIRQQLVAAGWAAEDVDAAIQAATSSVPVPPPVNVSSGLDVALYTGIFITLYASVIQLGTVLFQLINRQEAKAEELGTEIGKKNLELAKAARAHAALASLSADEETLDQYSIRKADVVPFLESIQGVGRPLGSKVDVLSVGDVQDGKHARIALSISITGRSLRRSCW
jgi:hypothetical protein